MRRSRAFLALAMLLAVGTVLPAQTSGWEVKNRFTAQGALYGDTYLPDGSLDLIWKPELFGEYSRGQKLRLSADVIIDNRLKLLFAGYDSAQNLNFKLYRAWGAVTWGQTEFKCGLQHIRMGPAQLLRPLMWFDRLVPGALLQETEGVKALTLSHFFPNPELRLWAMPGIGRSKGSELLPSRQGSWEFGGRLGVQNPLGETGISGHRREAEDPLSGNSAVEYRVGIDHRYDGVIGAWLEASANHLENQLISMGSDYPENSVSATLGGDYTFGVGNGLYLLAEQNVRFSGPTSLSYEEAQYQTALLLSYPLNLLDGLQLLAFYDIDKERGLATLAWRRTYDYLSWEVSVSLDSGYPAVLSSAPSLNIVINYDL